MKKVLLTLVLAFTGIFAANAQVWLGGSLAFNTNKYEDTRGTYYFLGPEVGYSFGNWSVATALGYSSGIDGAFDFIGWRDKYNVDGEITYGRDLQKTWQAGIKPGIAFHPTEKWAAVFHIGFIGYSKGSLGGIDNFPFPYDPGFSVDFSASTATFGLYYNF